MPFPFQYTHLVVLLLVQRCGQNPAYTDIEPVSEYELIRISSANGFL